MVAAILEVMLKPATDQMPVDFAKALLKLRAEGDILDRIEYLRPRANNGELTEDEQNEYREIVEAIDIIAVLQKKAMRVLEANSE